jgi:hypothetical protein
MAVEWPSERGKVTSRPELNLFGRSSMLLARTQTLQEAIIRRCIDIADFEHVRAKITDNLKDPG